jgi:hypothetical protein
MQTQTESAGGVLPVQEEFIGKWLSGSQRKTAFALRCNAETLVRECHLNSTGFLTLTVGDYFCREHGKQIPGNQNFCPACALSKTWRRMKFRGVNDAAEASRRVNNLMKWLKTIFTKGIVVTERHLTGAIHFHLIAGLASGADIRTGLDFDEIRRRNYRTASPALRGLWRQLRATLPKYGFGRHELLPIRKTGEAVAAYISKYVEKNVCNRTAADKNKKLVRYFGWKKCQLKPNEFEWNGERAIAWRGKAREIVGLVGVEMPDAEIIPAEHVKRACCVSAGKIRPKMLDGSQAREILGSRWAYHVTGLIRQVSDAAVPFMVWDYLTRQLVAREIGMIAGIKAVKFSEREKKYVVCGEIYNARGIRNDFDETTAAAILN